jgi:hypothetical protein
MSSELISIPNISFYNIELLLNNYIACLIKICQKDAELSDYFSKSVHINIQMTSLKLKNYTMVSLEYIKTHFDQKNYKNEFPLLFCIFLLVNETNEFIQNHIDDKFLLNFEKAYKSYDLKNVKTSMSFLIDANDYSCEQKLYLISSICISRLLHLFSSWFIDFFNHNKKHLYDFYNYKKISETKKIKNFLNIKI